MRQKTAVGCACLHRPRALLLDEPLTGLDPRGIRTMKDLIRENAVQGAAVVVSSHLLSMVEDLTTSVLILHRGPRVASRPADSICGGEAAAGDRHETLEELFFRLTEIRLESPWPLTTLYDGGDSPCVLRPVVFARPATARLACVSGRAVWSRLKGLS